jgi:hypothetical protein
VGEHDGPSSDAHLARFGKDLLRQGRRAREELVELRERLRRGRHLDVCLVGDRDVLRSLYLPAGLAPTGPDREGRNAPRRRVTLPAVDIHVVRHVRCSLGRAVQVLVHQRRPERVPQKVDLRLTGPLLEVGD